MDELPSYSDDEDDATAAFFASSVITRADVQAAVRVFEALKASPELYDADALKPLRKLVQPFAVKVSEGYFKGNKDQFLENTRAHSILKIRLARMVAQDKNRINAGVLRSQRIDALQKLKDELPDDMKSVCSLMLLECE